MGELGLTQALVRVNGSLPSVEDFNSAEAAIEAIGQRGDSEALYEVSSASEAASLYYARSEHKEMADRYARLKMLAESSIGWIYFNEFEQDAFGRHRGTSGALPPMVISGQTIGRHIRDNWRHWGIAHRRKLLVPLIERLAADPDEVIGSKAVEYAVRLSGATKVPVEPIRDAFRQSGLTYAELASRMGLGHKDVRRRLNPPAQRVGRDTGLAMNFRTANRFCSELGLDILTLPPVPLATSKEAVRQRRIERGRLRFREQMALREKERSDAIKRAVRKAGGAAAELYAMAERMQDILGQAHREASDHDRRQAFALAGEHYRKMRDEIARGFLAGSA